MPTRTLPALVAALLFGAGCGGVGPAVEADPANAAERERARAHTQWLLHDRTHDEQRHSPLEETRDAEKREA